MMTINLLRFLIAMAFPLLGAAQPTSQSEAVRLEEVLANAKRLSASGMHADAERMMQAALSDEKAFGPAGRVVLHSSLGLMLYEGGRLLDAERQHRAALSTAHLIPGETEQLLIRISLNLASTLLAAGQETRAEAVARTTLPKALTLGNSADAGRMLALLGTIARYREDTAEAESFYLRALVLFGEGSEPDLLESKAILDANFAALYGSMGRYTEASTHAQLALSLLDQLPAASPVTTTVVLREAAKASAAQGRIQQAAALLERAVALSERAFGPANALRADILFEYAAVLRELKRKREADSAEKNARTISAKAQRENLTGYTVPLRSLRP